MQNRLHDGPFLPLAGKGPSVGIGPVYNKTPADSTINHGPVCHPLCDRRQELPDYHGKLRCSESFRYSVILSVIRSAIPGRMPARRVALMEDIAKIIEGVTNFRGKAQQDDNITLVVLKMRGQV